MANSKKANSNNKILWQSGQEDTPGEPAILIEGYSDIMTISQDGNYINLNYESLKDFIKNLRQ